MGICVFLHKLGIMGKWERVFQIFTYSLGNLAQVHFYPKRRWQPVETSDRMNWKGSTLD